MSSIRCWEKFVKYSKEDFRVSEEWKNWKPGMAFRGEHGQKMYLVGPWLWNEKDSTPLAVIDSNKSFWRTTLGTYPYELMTRDPENDIKEVLP